jgi:hypothetical protein
MATIASPVCTSSLVAGMRPARYFTGERRMVFWRGWWVSRVKFRPGIALLFCFIFISLKKFCFYSFKKEYTGGGVSQSDPPSNFFHFFYTEIKEITMGRIVLSFLLVAGLIAQVAVAREIAGVTVDESIKTGDGVELKLNGAGIRSKFFFDIYIAELYMENPATTSAEVIAAPGGKRMVMHFLYDEVGRDKLVEGWDEGFAENTTAEGFAAIKERALAFNSYFVDVKKGDQVILDFRPGTGTTVSIAGQEKGTIPGKDFNDALLNIWLGEKPVTSSLRAELLGGK